MAKHTIYKGKITMYDKSILLEVISDTVENRIIDFLIEGRGFDYSKTDIANGCDISRPTVYKVLPKLLEVGVVKVARNIGRITLYALDFSNERVKALVRLEEQLLQGSFASAGSNSSIPIESKSTNFSPISAAV